MSEQDPGSGETLISVLIPAYNAARYIQQTLESVSAQTHAHLEIIVVDDGSRDETPDILSRYQQTEPRLRVIQQANGGISTALNTGLAGARGRFVARIDADDLMVPERLELQHRFLTDHPDLGFCASSMDFIDEAGTKIGEYDAPIANLAELDETIAQRKIFSFTHPTVMFRRSSLAAIGDYRAEFEPCEDLDLFLRLIEAGLPGVAMRERLSRYRLHGNSISGRNARRQIRMSNYLFDRFYRQRDGRLPLGYADFVKGPNIASRWLSRSMELGAALTVQANYVRAAGSPLSATVMRIAAYGFKAPGWIGKLLRFDLRRAVSRL